MVELTQEQMTSWFENIKIAWEDAVKESGMRSAMLIAMGLKGEASMAMHRYVSLKELAEELGFSIPPLTDSIEVRVIDCEEEKPALH